MLKWEEWKAKEEAKQWKEGNERISSQNQVLSDYIGVTGLPAYSDTVYSEFLLTVTVFWSKFRYPYTNNRWLE